MIPLPRLRDIRYEKDARDSVDIACNQWARAEDQIALLEWAIVRDPREGEAMTESGVVRSLTLPGAQSIGAPTVTFVYEIVDDNCIAIHSARFEDAKAEPQTRH